MEKLIKQLSEIGVTEYLIKTSLRHYIDNVEIPQTEDSIDFYESLREPEYKKDIKNLKIELEKYISISEKLGNL